MDNEFDRIAETAYGESWRNYHLLLDEIEDEVKNMWMPIVYGAMIKQPLRDFLIRFDWSKDEPMVIPPNGEMPEKIQLLCYYAKRLDPAVVASELPKGAKELFEETKREMLYGSSTLSVLEAYEATL